MINEKITKLILTVGSVVAILLLIFSPYLLVINLDYAPMVMMIWIISTAYFLFKDKWKKRDDENDKNNENNESDESDK